MPPEHNPESNPAVEAMRKAMNKAVCDYLHRLDPRFVWEPIEIETEDGGEDDGPAPAGGATSEAG